jgi:hypothetical protein
MVDPLDAYIAWNFCEPGHEQNIDVYKQNYIHLSDLDISSRFWSKKTIENFIAANCSDVLAQRLISSWHFVFISMEEKELFVNWFRQQTLGDSVSLEIKNQKYREEILAWVKSQHVEYVANFIGKHELRLIFRHEQDKIHFLLRWLHIEEEVKE